MWLRKTCLDRSARFLAIKEPRQRIHATPIWPSVRKTFQQKFLLSYLLMTLCICTPCTSWSATSSHKSQDPLGSWSSKVSRLGKSQGNETLGCQKESLLKSRRNFLVWFERLRSPSFVQIYFLPYCQFFCDIYKKISEQIFFVEIFAELEGFFFSKVGEFLLRFETL